MVALELVSVVSLLHKGLLKLVFIRTFITGKRLFANSVVLDRCRTVCAEESLLRHSEIGAKV